MKKRNRILLTCTAFVALLLISHFLPVSLVNDYTFNMPLKWVKLHVRFDVVLTLIPWCSLALLFFIGFKLVAWAKRQRTGAYVFGAMVQMVLPDPYAERTIQVVQENKKSVKKQKEVEGEPL